MLPSGSALTLPPHCPGGWVGFLYSKVVLSVDVCERRIYFVAFLCEAMALLANNASVSLLSRDTGVHVP